MPDSAPPKRCVIADDVRASRETVGSWLRECGFECALAGNGQHAWELVKEQPPDLLVTDFEMPVLCGLELLEKTREADDEQLCELPVLVMTSLCDRQTLNIVQQMGGDGLLQKPLDKRATLATILDLISSRKSLQQIVYSDDENSVKGKGMISPALRRLLQTVARNERF